MSNLVAVVGGHGQVARQLHPLLVASGRTPVALVRSEQQRAVLEQVGAQVRLLDLERDDVEAFARAFTGCDAVVFAAGGGPDGNIERKRTVDLEGATTSIAAARLAGVARFVMVSAIAVDEPLPEDVQPVWRAYVEAKRDADRAVRESGLDWTILRPGRLTDEPATGLVSLAPELPRGDVPRADVAAVLTAVLDDPATVGRQWTLVGGSVPVAEAVAAATSGDPSRYSTSEE